MSTKQTGRQTKTPLGLKATPDCKARLAELTEIISEDLGARITLSQAFEIAINEALAKRKAGQVAD